MGSTGCRNRFGERAGASPISSQLPQQRADVLALGDTGGAVAGGRLRPFCDPVETYPVLDGLAQDRDAELRHRTRRLRRNLALPKFRDGQRHGFIERVGFDLDGLFGPLGIGVSDSARAHRSQYTRADSPFIRPVLNAACQKESSTQFSSGG